MEIKEMVERARKAQVIYDERFDQERVDQVIKVAARTIFDHAEELARLTIDETQGSMVRPEREKIHGDPKY